MRIKFFILIALFCVQSIGAVNPAIRLKNNTKEAIAVTPHTDLEWFENFLGSGPWGDRAKIILQSGEETIVRHMEFLTYLGLKTLTGPYKGLGASIDINDEGLYDSDKAALYLHIEYPIYIIIEMEPSGLLTARGDNEFTERYVLWNNPRRPRAIHWDSEIKKAQEVTAALQAAKKLLIDQQIAKPLDEAEQMKQLTQLFTDKGWWNNLDLVNYMTEQFNLKYKIGKSETTEKAIS